MQFRTQDRFGWPLFLVVIWYGFFLRIAGRSCHAPPYLPASVWPPLSDALSLYSSPSILS